MKKTALYDEHLKLGARIVEFSDWLMPVFYKNIIDEHLNVRNKVGLFDICHMGEFEVKGRDAGRFIQKIITNDIDRLKDGTAQYACMCYDNGGTVDDLFVYRINESHYMLVVNAANISKDFEWIKSSLEKENNAANNKLDVELINLSENTAKIDIQGPAAESILQEITAADLAAIKRFHFMYVDLDLSHHGYSVFRALISRTGYTAEDGFEIYFNPGHAVQLWRALLKSGAAKGLKAVGLGARDTLRIEACYSLYGHELNEDISPVEAGIGWVVRKNKPDFIGKDVSLSGGLAITVQTQESFDLGELERVVEGELGATAIDVQEESGQQSVIGGLQMGGEKIIYAFKVDTTTLRNVSIAGIVIGILMCL